MFKLKQALLYVAFFCLVLSNPTDAQQGAPTSDKAKQIEALVNKAALLIERDGKAAFAEFRRSGTAWFSGDTYLFVYDLKSNVLLNAAFPARGEARRVEQFLEKLLHDGCSSSEEMSPEPTVRMHGV